MPANRPAINAFDDDDMDELFSGGHAAPRRDQTSAPKPGKGRSPMVVPEQRTSPVAASTLHEARPSVVPPGVSSDHATASAPSPDESESELEQFSAYIRPDHFDKLDAFLAAYKKMTGKRRNVNRQTILRLILDQTDLDTFLNHLK